MYQFSRICSHNPAKLNTFWQKPYFNILALPHLHLRFGHTKQIFTKTQLHFSQSIPQVPIKSSFPLQHKQFQRSSCREFYTSWRKLTSEDNLSTPSIKYLCYNPFLIDVSNYLYSLLLNSPRNYFIYSAFSLIFPRKLTTTPALSSIAANANIGSNVDSPSL